MTTKEFADAVIKELGEGSYVIKPNQIRFMHPDFAGLGVFPEHIGLDSESVTAVANNLRAQWQKRRKDTAHSQVETIIDGSSNEVLHGKDISKEETEKPKRTYKKRKGSKGRG